MRVGITKPIDGLPALALAAELLPKDLMESSQKPSPKNFFDKTFYHEMIFIGVTISLLALAVDEYSFYRQGEIRARTHFFSFLVFAELFRSFASRSETQTFFQLGVFSNVHHLVAVALPITFQILLHHMSWFETIFEVDTISWKECGYLVGLTLIPTTLLELRKGWKGQKQVRAGCSDELFGFFRILTL